MAGREAGRPAIERRMAEQLPGQQTLFECCWRCNAPLVWRLAEARSTGGGCRQQVWRCTSCESLTRTGWRPPCWISATARVWHELDDALAAAIADAYTAKDSDA